MNSNQRIFHPLFGRQFWFRQSENAELKYIGNWIPSAQGNDITESEWEVLNGNVVLSSEALSDNQTSVIISGNTGWSRVVNQVIFTDGQVDERILNINILENSDDVVCDYGYSRAGA